MVQVYSVSSSSLTVQLYSRSRFLMLPLTNRLNIFLGGSLPCVWEQNNKTKKKKKTQRRRAGECHIDHVPRSPKRPAAED